jgi:hypothetical protein
MLRKLLPILMMAAMLTGCHGLGFSQFNSASDWTTENAEDKQEESWWDHFWGRKSNSPESSAWKDFYGPADEGPTKWEHCGYWGNCTKSGQVAAPAPAAAPSCDFYGNCKAATTKSGLGW